MDRDELPKDRLRAAREAKGYQNPTDAARGLKVNENTYTSHENGNRAISKKAAADYAAKLGVTAGWLLYGEAPSHAPPSPNDVSDDAPALYRKLSERDRRIVDSLISSLLASRPEETQ